MVDLKGGDCPQLLQQILFQCAHNCESIPPLKLLGHGNHREACRVQYQSSINTATKDLQLAQFDLRDSHVVPGHQSVVEVKHNLTSDQL